MDSPEIPENCTILQALDTAWEKFRRFVNESLRDAGIPEEMINNINFKMQFDVLIYVADIKKFLEEHEKALKNEEVEYFRALLPAEFKNVEIPKKTSDKGFLFARVFNQLIKDIEA